jgi:hypothetical protein
LIEEIEVGGDFERRWIGQPIVAVAGQPGVLPKE